MKFLTLEYVTINEMIDFKAFHPEGDLAAKRVLEYPSSL